MRVIRPRRVVAVLAVFTALTAAVSTAGAAPPTAPAEQTRTVAESPTGSYIVVLEGEGLAARLGVDALDTPAADQLVDALVAEHEAVLEEAGASAGDKVQDYVNALDGFSAALSHDEAIAVANHPQVKLVMPDELHQVTTDASPKFLGLSGDKGVWSTGLTGEDVVVGVIDTGIWPEHPSFADTELRCIDRKGKEKEPKKDGTCPKKTTPTEVQVYGPPPVVLDDTYRPSCEFGNTAHNPDDAPFTCNNKLIGARQMLDTYRYFIGADPDEFDSARDDNGHGTHTASTAAGNAGVDASILGVDYGEISGIAPRARVIAYKALGNLGGFTSDLVSAIDQAVADGVDVINYSVGGGASLATPDAIAFLFAADAGVLVATSAGNSGPDPETVGGPADVPWVTSVGASTQERFFEAEIELGDDTEISGASITPMPDDELDLVDAADAGGDLCIPGTLDPEVVAGKIVLCRRGAIARVAKSEAVYLAGGAGMILYNNSDTDNLMTDTHWVPSVHVDLTEGLIVKEYIASTDEPVASLDEVETEEWEPAPSMAIFSSRGPNPTAPDIIKPDITAPGVQILAGASPAVDPGEVPGQLFMAIAGTSMSSPHVAGLFALLRQAHPDWSAAMAKSAIMTTADTEVVDNDRVSPAGAFAMGAGHVDPGRVGKPGSMFDPGIVYDAGFYDYVAFLCGADPAAVSASFCGLLEAFGFSTDPSDLNLASIGIAELAGSQTVVRTVTSVADTTLTWKVKVDAPAGYTVDVVPATLTLAPGESATYSVTITSDGTAPLGAWREGSLTWKSGKYSARSPIAVRGTQIDVPSSVSGSGTAGSLSIPVSFGYTGAYSAAAHGMAPETIVSDTVVQDPDQDFDPADGFSNAHTFDLTGATHFRVALPPSSVVDPGAIDLDLYVTDPNGDLVAFSFNGGTDELIDIAFPMPGVWTVWVHGWQTAGPSADYDLSAWVVPDAATNLMVDAAPPAATIATTGTVDVSWSGLSAGTSYLGSVTHDDGSGVIAVTLVDVTG